MSFRPNLSTAEVGVKNGDAVLSLMLPPRSLVVFADAAYRDFLHSIEPALEEVVPSLFGAPPTDHDSPTAIAARARAMMVGPIGNASAASVAPGDQFERASRRVSLTFRRTADRACA